MQRNVDRDVTQRPSSDVAQFLCDVMNNTKVDYHYVREKVIEGVVDLSISSQKHFQKYIVQIPKITSTP